MKVIFYGFAICFAVGLLMEIYNVYKIKRRLNRQQKLKEERLKQELQIKIAKFKEVEFLYLNIDEIFWRIDIPIKCKKLSSNKAIALGINSKFEIQPYDKVKIKVENE